MKPANSFFDEEFSQYRERVCLEQELGLYEAQGVGLYLEGRQSNPGQISMACMVAESGEYMRDYVEDDSGRVTEIRFDRVRNR